MKSKKNFKSNSKVLFWGTYDLEKPRARLLIRGAKDTRFLNHTISTQCSAYSDTLGSWIGDNNLRANRGYDKNTKKITGRNIYTLKKMELERRVKTKNSFNRDVTLKSRNYK